MSPSAQNQNPTITEVTRHSISDALILNKIAWWGRFEEQQFLARLYDLSGLAVFLLKTHMETK